MLSDKIKKKYLYNDTFSPIVEEIMQKADCLSILFWDSKLFYYKVKCVYDLPKNVLHKSYRELAIKYIDFMKWAENYFLENTFKSDDYPDGCIHRANRCIALWTRWDWKYKGIIPSYKFYS